MITCKNCKTELNENEQICKVCNYPVQGTEKEQASYFAKQVIQKSTVKQSIDRLKKSRIILFVLGIFYFIVPFTPLVKTGKLYVVITMIVLGLIFTGFGFLSFKKPKISLLIPLIITTFYYIILFFINPILVYKGILWKMIILMGLGYGYLSVRKADKILKENKYLASILGNDKKNKDNS